MSDYEANIIHEKNSVRTRCFESIVRSDNIIESTVLPNSRVSLQDARDQIKSLILLTDGEMLPLLIDLNQILSITKEARNYFASDDRPPAGSPVALLINSHIGRIIGNLYMNLNRPKKKTRLFTEKTAALKWLAENRT